jgi:8-oxo-dGTP diphosphatase
MEFNKLLESRSEQAWQDYVPHLSIDCVVFGFQAGQLKVLLVQLLNTPLWALPGGYVRKKEDIDLAAHRILQDRTGATQIFLEQFKVFGSLQRSEDFFADLPDTIWNKQRFISIGYYALVDVAKVQLQLDDISQSCEWIAIEDMPNLMMDHQQIVAEALKTLRRQLNEKPIGLNLLPQQFTMPELQKLYEVILGQTLNRGNFYRKLLRYGILDKSDDTRKGGAHKSPDLYRFNLEKYHQCLQEGWMNVW